MNRRKIIFICCGILLIAAVVTYFIFITEPTAQSEAATKKTAALVEVMEVEKGDFHPQIVTTGSVQAVENVMLSPLVGGQIIRRSPAFIPGGFVEEGTVLLQIDPSDYRNQVQLRKSELIQAQTELAREMGRQEVAEQDLRLIGGDSLSENQRSLVLREPQLNAARANVKAARAAVDQAQLALARTTIRAPFDAHILSQNVTVGSQVSPGDDLGRLVGTEYYWVTLALPVNKLQWLNFPNSEEEKGSLVKIRNNTAWSDDIFRIGYLQEQIGALDDETRLARVLVKVPDPLAQNKENEDLPKLMIGSFIEAEIEGTEIEDVVRIPREFVRRNQTVWIMENGKLSIREPEIVLTDSEYAYVTGGLEDEELLVTTNLSTVAEGVNLRRKTTDSLPKENNREAPAPEE